jgi:hypothetical protein
MLNLNRKILQGSVTSITHIEHYVQVSTGYMDTPMSPMTKTQCTLEKSVS